MGPSSASGGMMAFTREPSGRRASTIGEDSSTLRPTAETIRWMIWMRWAPDLLLHHFRRKRVQLREVELLDQLLVDAGLKLVIGVLTPARRLVLTVPRRLSILKECHGLAASLHFLGIPHEAQQ